MFKKMWIEALRNKMVVTVIVHYIWLKRELVGKGDLILLCSSGPIPTVANGNLEILV